MILNKEIIEQNKLTIDDNYYDLLMNYEGELIQDLTYSDVNYVRVIIEDEKIELPIEYIIFDEGEYDEGLTPFGEHFEKYKNYYVVGFTLLMIYLTYLCWSVVPPVDSEDKNYLYFKRIDSQAYSKERDLSKKLLEKIELEDKLEDIKTNIKTLSGDILILNNKKIGV